MRTLLLNHLLDLSGSLVLGEDFSISEGHTETSYYYDSAIGDRGKVSRRYNKKFTILVSESKPKKVNRKCEFYVPEGSTEGIYYLFYIKDSKCLFKDAAPITVDKNGGFVLNLTEYLKSKDIEYHIPEYRKISYDDKLRMMSGYSSEKYGARYYLSEGGVAFDGSGDGYIYYLAPGSLTCDGIPINKLLIHSYNLASISPKVSGLLEKCPLDLSSVQLCDLIDLICSGNEIGIATDTVDIHISRHYSSGIKLNAFGEKMTFGLPSKDRKHSIGPDEKLLEKVEKQYSGMLKELIACKTSGAAKHILEDCIDSIEKL